MIMGLFENVQRYVNWLNVTKQMNLTWSFDDKLGIWVTYNYNVTSEMVQEFAETARDKGFMIERWKTDGSKFKFKLVEKGVNK